MSTILLLGCLLYFFLTVFILIKLATKDEE